MGDRKHDEAVRMLFERHDVRKAMHDGTPGWGRSPAGARPQRE
jgi:hypothetical protein